MSFVEGSFNIIKYQNGTRKVSLVVRCPLFKGVLYKEGFHCIRSTVHVHVHVVMCTCIITIMIGDECSQEFDDFDIGIRDTGTDYIQYGCVHV